MKSPDKTMMHGIDYAGQDPTGWIATEKFDGHFARWTGTNLLTREGIDYNPPGWFTAGLPCCALDCELFAGYGNRLALNGAPRWRDRNRWRCAELIALDAPARAGGFEARHDAILEQIAERPGLRIAELWVCAGKPGLVESLAGIRAKGGEGLVVRHPAAFYTIGRVNTMLKVKPEFIR